MNNIVNNRGSFSYKGLIDKRKKEKDHDLEIFKANINKVIKAKPTVSIEIIKRWLGNHDSKV